MSPPPATDVIWPFAVFSATRVATALVPVSKGLISKTPIGPFQRIVLQVSKADSIFAIVSGPMSMAMRPVGIAVASVIWICASCWISVTVVKSVGRRISQPMDLAFSRISRASAFMSSS